MAQVTKTLRHRTLNLFETGHMCLKSPLNQCSRLFSSRSTTVTNFAQSQASCVNTMCKAKEMKNRLGGVKASVLTPPKAAGFSSLADSSKLCNPSHKRFPLSPLTSRSAQDFSSMNSSRMVLSSSFKGIVPGFVTPIRTVSFLPKIQQRVIMAGFSTGPGGMSPGSTGCGGTTPGATRWMGVRFQCRRDYSAAIIKHVSALTVKRPTRKKMLRVAEEEVEKYADVVVAYAVAEELNLTQLRQALQVQGLYHICELPVDVQDALHVRAKYAVDEKNREMFLFRDGSAVFWAMPEVERKEILRFLQKHDNGRYSARQIGRTTEEMDVKYFKGPTSVNGDTLQLNEESDESHQLLEKYAFSNALAQSVKLAVWEGMLDRFIDSIEFVPEDLRDAQKIRMSRREVLRKTGELFALRHLINLSSDLLDTPDFYWDRAVLEPLYVAVYNHLEIARRTRVMNEKLSHCCELMELLRSHLDDAHHTRLEVMIIVLIMVEVVFEIAHYLERYYIAVDEKVQQQTDIISAARELATDRS